MLSRVVAFSPIMLFCPKFTSLSLFFHFDLLGLLRCVDVRIRSLCHSLLLLFSYVLLLLDSSRSAVDFILRIFGFSDKEIDGF